MMKEEAIPITLNITRIGQREYFQVALPADTKRIIGLEHGAILKNAEGAIIRSVILPQWLNFNSNKVIGKLSLSVAGCENVFYQEDLVEEMNIHFGEPVASLSLGPELWTHGRKREEVEVSVKNETTLVEGLFVDSWGVDEYEIMEYQLHLYLWIEKTVCP